jgi:hypothetical protein
VGEGLAAQAACGTLRLGVVTSAGGSDHTRLMALFPHLVLKVWPDLLS